MNLKDDSDDEDGEIVNFEGYLLKITQTKKLKKLWFKLIHKDLYCNYFINSNNYFNSLSNWKLVNLWSLFLSENFFFSNWKIIHTQCILVQVVDLLVGCKLIYSLCIVTGSCKCKLTIFTMGRYDFVFCRLKGRAHTDGVNRRKVF